MLSINECLSQACTQRLMSKYSAIHRTTVIQWFESMFLKPFFHKDFAVVDRVGCMCYDYSVRVA